MGQLKWRTYSKVASSLANISFCCCVYFVILVLVLFTPPSVCQSCADPESFVRGGPTLTTFLIDEGRDDPNTTLIGPSLASQRFAGVPMMAQHWMLVGSFVIFQGIRTCIAKEPNSLVLFHGVGSEPPAPPSGSAHGVNAWSVIVAFPSRIYWDQYRRDAIAQANLRRLTRAFAARIHNVCM